MRRGGYSEPCRTVHLASFLKQSGGRTPKPIAAYSMESSFTDACDADWRSSLTLETAQGIGRPLPQNARAGLRESRSKPAD
jgi:hypothetical protein